MAAKKLYLVTAQRSAWLKAVNVLADAVRSHLGAQRPYVVLGKVIRGTCSQLKMGVSVAKKSTERTSSKTWARSMGEGSCFTGQRKQP